MGQGCYNVIYTIIGIIIQNAFNLRSTIKNW